MFGYNPTVQDRSGELMANGISQAAQGISGSLDQLTKYKLAADQTDATAGIAQKMGLFNSQKDPDGSQALAMIQATPWNQKVSIGPSIVQMAGQQALMNYHLGSNAIRQQALDMKGAGGTESKIVPL